MRGYVLNGTGGADGLTLTELPDPVAGPNQVVVAIKAVSLNYRDLMVAGNFYSGNTPAGQIPVADGAGEVIAVGPGVSKVKIGDRVVSTFIPEWQDGRLADGMAARSIGANGVPGVLSERALLPGSGVVKIPDGLSYEQAATLPIAALTAWNVLFEQNQTRPGTRVLLLGTGGVSVFGLQLAKLAGAHVSIISSSDDKLARARQMGADVTVNYRDVPDWDRAIIEATGGVDIALEVTGYANLERTLSALRSDGAIGFIGGVGGDSVPADIGQIIFKNIRINGTLVGTVAMFERMMTAIGQHGLQPVIDRSFGFAEARDAYAYLQAGGHFGKIVIRVAD